MDKMDSFDSLEKKLEEVASERSNLIKDNRELNEKLAKQEEKLNRFKESLKEEEQKESEIKKRLDGLIEFLENLPILKEQR